MCLASAVVVLVLAQAPSSYQQIVAQVGQRPTPELCAELEAWVSGHSADPDAGRALIWLGERYREQRDVARARKAYRSAVTDHPGTEWSLAGEKGLAELALSERHFSEAEAHYRVLAARPESLWSFLGRQGLAETGVRRGLWIALLAAFGFLAVLNPGRLLFARARLWPPPNEPLYLLPVFGLLAVAALAQPAAEAGAVLCVCGGALFILFCNAAYFRARPPRGLARYRELLLGLLQAAALLYCAIAVSGLWHKLVDTLAMGPE